MRAIEEGSVFYVLLGAEYFVGVVARRSQRRKGTAAIYAYFFGPYSQVPTLEDLNRSLRATNALTILMSSALYLGEGRWPIIGTLSNWSRADWPLFEFVRYDELRKKHLVIKYDEDDILRVVSESPTRVPEGLLPDGLCGAEAAEILVAQTARAKKDSVPTRLH